MGYLIFNFGIVPGLLAILISQAGNNAPFLQLGRCLCSYSCDLVYIPATSIASSASTPF
jgi:hypothetical protein